jgi:hypothetical protein
MRTGLRIDITIRALRTTTAAAPSIITVNSPLKKRPLGQRAYCQDRANL